MTGGALKSVMFSFLLINDAGSVNSPGAAAESAASIKGNESSASESSADENLMVDEVPGLLGVLLGLRNLMPLTCDVSLTATDSAFQLKGSFGAKVTETDIHIDIVLVLRVNCFNFYLSRVTFA